VVVLRDSATITGIAVTNILSGSTSIHNSLQGKSKNLRLTFLRNLKAYLNINGGAVSSKLSTWIAFYMSRVHIYSASELKKATNAFYALSIGSSIISCHYSKPLTFKQNQYNSRAQLLPYGFRNYTTHIGLIKVVSLKWTEGNTKQPTWLLATLSVLSILTTQPRLMWQRFWLTESIPEACA